MLIFDRYLFIKVLISTVVGVVFMSSLALSGQLLKEIQTIFSPDAQGFKLLFQFLLNTFPYILSYMLPWAFLTAVLLTVKSLSSNNEIVSIRMSGQSYFRITRPILILGIFFSGLLYYTTGSITPNSRVKINELLSPSQATDGGINLSPYLLKTLLGDSFQIHANTIEDNTIKNLHLYEIDPDTQKPSTYIHAKEAQLDFNQVNRASVVLNQVYLETSNGDAPPETLNADQIAPLVLPIKKKLASTRAKYQQNNEIVNYLQNQSKQKPDPKRELDYFSELCSRISMSLSCLSFSILGLPLGLQNNRKLNNNGFLWGIITAALFFGSLVALEEVGDSFLIRGFAIFTPNIVAILVGIFLYRKIRFS